MAYAAAGRRARRRGGHHADDVRGDAPAAPRCSARAVVFADVEEDTAQPRPGGGRPPRSPTGPGSSPRSTTPATRPTTTPCAAWPTAPARCCSPTRRTRSASRYRGRPVGHAGRPDHVLVLPDQEPHHRRGRRGRQRPTRSWPSGPASSATSGWSATATGCAHPDEGAWHQEVHEFGLNYRLPDVLCALGCSQLRRLGGFQAAPRRARRPLRRGAWPTCPALRLPAPRGRRRPGLAPLPGPRPRRPPPRGVRADARGRHRRAGQLPAGLLAPGLRGPRLPARACARSPRSFYAEELSLPLFPDLTDADQDRVVDALGAALRGDAPTAADGRCTTRTTSTATPTCSPATAGWRDGHPPRINGLRPARLEHRRRARARHPYVPGDPESRVVGADPAARLVAGPAATGRDRRALGLPARAAAATTRRRQPREGTIWYPFHGWEGQHVKGDHDG